jgi:hypothetical protein
MTTALYERISDGLRVEVDMLLEEGHWFARLHNSEAGIEMQGRMMYGEGISPWCLDLPTFSKRYRSVAPRLKLGDE